jgi:hypothetical protein
VHSLRPCETILAIAQTERSLHKWLDLMTYRIDRRLRLRVIRPTSGPSARPTTAPIPTKSASERPMLPENLDQNPDLWFPAWPAGTCTKCVPLLASHS